jgi:hypothetical protein
MQQSNLPTKFAAAFAVGCCCALLVNAAWSQTPARRVAAAAPVNPLRSSTAQPQAITKPDRLVQPAQATESLPAPLQRAPAEPELSPQPEASSVLAPGSQTAQPEQYFEGDPNSWPADAPAMQHYGGPYGHRGHHSHPPREPWFSHDDPNDAARHTGWGDPLTGTSWLNRPWYVGVFVGGMLADDLVANHVEADSSPIAGLRLGNDFDHFWGWETRYAYTRVETFTGPGVPIAEPAREYFVDVALLHYPWGDSHWRPYLLAGIGFQNVRYVNDAVPAQFIDDTALTIPLGVGLKIYNSPWFTIRFDATDNLTFGGGHLDAGHNFSLMMGVEYRFGGKRPSYFPWSGNTSYW